MGEGEQPLPALAEPGSVEEEGDEEWTHVSPAQVEQKNERTYLRFRELIRPGVIELRAQVGEEREV